ncbi:hypothetical protein B0H21DRAFT_891664 [Amylocystis lapponica]|nr:hypothetical protein B0H21DRAFT_891664 [Amylocystis lapponica]
MHPFRTRLFCIIAGSVSATVLCTAYEGHRYSAIDNLCWRHRIPRHAYVLPGAARCATTNSSDMENRTCNWDWARDHISSPTESRERLRVLPTPRPAVQWEEEARYMQVLGTQAMDAVVDVSEATLVSLLSKVQRFKARLAERRARREKQLPEVETMLQKRLDTVQSFPFPSRFEHY